MCVSVGSSKFSWVRDMERGFFFSISFLWVSYHSVFYKPLCQSLGYQPVTVATRLAGHLHGTRSHVVTWPPISHTIGRCVLATSIHMLLVGTGAPTNSLSSHFHTLTVFSLFCFSPSLLCCSASLRPFPLSFCLARQTQGLYYISIMLQSLHGFTFDTSALSNCM